MLIQIFFNTFPPTYPSQRYNLPPPFDFIYSKTFNFQLFPENIQNSGVYKYLVKSSCKFPQFSLFPHISLKFFPMYYVFYTFIHLYIHYGQNLPAFLGHGGPFSEHVIFFGKI